MSKAGPTDPTEKSGLNARGLVPTISYMAAIAAGVIILLDALSILYEILKRLFTDFGTIWVYEYSGYALIWFTFLSVAYVLYMRRHIFIELFVDRLTPITQSIIFATHQTFITLIIGGAALYMSFKTIHAFNIGKMAPTPAGTLMYVVYGGAAVGLICFFAQCVHTLIGFLRDCLAAEGRVQYAVLAIGAIAIVLEAALWSYSPSASIFLLMCTFLFFGMPIFAALLGAGVIGLLYFFGPHLAFVQLADIGIKATDSNALLAIPFFILAGAIFNNGGIGAELYQLANALIGRVRGGLGVATILACGIFAAITGSSVATAATIGLIAIPEMLKRNYEEKRIYGLVAAGGTLGILIPPSAPMILYSGMTNESTGQLFMGGVMPGLVTIVILSIYSLLTTNRDTVTYVAPTGHILSALRESVWIIILPVLVLGGIYFGIMTATEAGAFALVYALVVSIARRTISMAELRSTLAEGTITSGMIMMIIVGAITLGQIVTLLHIPDNLLAYIQYLGLNKWEILAILTIGYIILGMFLEVVSILLITLPIVYPLIIAVGFNGLWFGVYLTMLMELALITPPVGLNLFVIRDVAHTDTAKVIKGVTPYFALLGISIALVIIFPELALWLPSKMIGH